MTGRQGGFALLVVLLAVGLLGLLGMRIVAAGRTDTQIASDLVQRARLEEAAEGAVAQVAFRIAAVHDPALRPDGVTREVQVGRVAVLVRVENETDRVNLNTASAPLLRALVMEVGGVAQAAGPLAAAIVDWRTPGEDGLPGGAKAAQYRAAGRPYDPPGAPFRSVAELGDVLGMTPELLARLAPHLTVMTDADPDLTTRDPIVARALTDVGVTDAMQVQGGLGDPVLRVRATALGNSGARVSVTEVVTPDFAAATPRLDILLRRRGGEE
jgi:general secretion pathway protein K